MLNFDLKPPSKDRLTDLIENFFVSVLDRLLAVYQKLAQSEQLNGTTFLGRVYRVKANIAKLVNFLIKKFYLNCLDK